MGDLPDKGGEVAQLSQRDLGNDGLHAVLIGFHAQHAAAALGHIAHDIAGVVVGDMGLQGMDGLQNDGACLGHCSLIGQLCSHDKGHLGAVHGVVAAIQQGSLQADHRITGQHALFGGKADTLFHCREEILGHAAAEHLFLKHDLLAVTGLEVDDDIAELAVAAGLLLMAALLLAGLADGLTVGNAGSFQTDEFLHFMDEKMYSVEPVMVSTPSYEFQPMADVEKEFLSLFEELKEKIREEESKK